jgi:CMP-N-acetylneuraminic acid synthetase
MVGNSRPVIALIPARGGSKGVSRKNLRMIAGRPLIAFTLVAASDCQYVDSVFVSSDDEAILDVAREHGAREIRRPAEFATDEATAADVVNHFIDQLPRDLCGQDPYVVYLQPTSPLRTAGHIDEAIESMLSSGRHTLVSVTDIGAVPFKSFVVGKDGTLESLFEEEFSNARRQDLPTSFLANGAIYVFRISDFVNRGGFPSNGSHPYVMSEVVSLDIDTESDVTRLKTMMGDM